MCGVCGNMSTGRTVLQLVARVDHLARVGGQRGGVAGHVDDLRAPRPRAPGAPPSGTGPARGGSTTTTSGRPVLLEQRAHRGAHVARVEAGVVHAVEARRSRSRRPRLAPPAPRRTPRAHRAPGRARSCRCRRRGRTPARGPLRPASSTAERVEPLGHLGVGLEEGVGRDPEAQLAGRAPPRARPAPFSVLVSPPRVVSATPSAGVHRTRRPGVAAASSSASEVAPGLVTIRAWSWPVRRPSRTTRLRRKPVWLARSQADSPSSRHQRLHRLAQRVDPLGGEHVLGSRRRSGPSARDGGSRAPARPSSSSPNEYSSLLR